MDNIIIIDRPILLIMKDYSTIKELVENIKTAFKTEVVDTWVENKFLVCLTDGEITTLDGDGSGKSKSFTKGCLKIKARIPI